MTLSARELQEVVAEVAPSLIGGRVENVHVAPERVVALTFRKAGEKLVLLLSAEPDFARIHIARKRPPAPEEPPPFCRSLRRFLKGSRLVGLRQVAADRIAELEFSGAHPAGFAQPGAPGHKEGASPVTLVHELFGRRPNLLLLDAERAILVALGGGRRLRRGEPYEPPPLPEDAARPSGPSPPAAGLPREGHFPVSRELEERYARERVQALARSRRDSLLRLLGRERKRRQVIVAKVEEDLSRASERERDRRMGELLKGAYGRLRKGLEKIEVIDYFSPDMRPVSVVLDPRLSPRENIERYFDRFRKARRAVHFLTERRAVLRREIHSLESLEESVRGADELGRLEILENRARSFSRRGRQRRRAGEQVSASSGPRRFVSADGYEILIGRSARENDRLTLRLARGNDLFLHVAGRRGAHVIVRTRPGEEVPRETLIDAAQLAVYYSSRRSGGVPVKGARADVDYSPVKYVRKPRGAKPGAVLLATHKTLRVEVDPQRLERLRRRTEGDIDRDTPR